MGLDAIRGVASAIWMSWMYRLKGKPHLVKQVDRYFQHLGLDSAKVHTRVMLPKIAELGPADRMRVLLIGCCNMLEVDAFLAAGYKSVIGIDLVSVNPKYIKVMDMHDMEFEDGAFDLVYISGAFHCTHAPLQLVGQITRVLASPGFLVVGVPVEIDISEVYQYDVRSLQNLCSLFSRSHSVVYNRLEAPLTAQNPHKDKYLRAIVKFD